MSSLLLYSMTTCTTIEFTHLFSFSRLKLWVRVVHRSIDFYIMIKTRDRGAYYTQGRIIFEVLRYIYIYIYIYICI